MVNGNPSIPSGIASPSRSSSTSAARLFLYPCLSVDIRQPEHRPHKSNINLILACAALHRGSRNHCSRPVTSRGGELILCIAFRDGTGSEKNRPCKLPRWLPLVVSADITFLAPLRAKPGPQLWDRAELYGNERRHCVTV